MGHCVYIGFAGKEAPQLTSSVQSDFVIAMLHNARATYRRQKEQQEQAELQKELAEMKARGENPSYGFGWAGDFVLDSAWYPSEAVSIADTQVPSHYEDFLNWYAVRNDKRIPVVREHTPEDFVKAREFLSEAARMGKGIYSC